MAEVLGDNMVAVVGNKFPTLKLVTGQIHVHDLFNSVNRNVL